MLSPVSQDGAAVGGAKQPPRGQPSPAAGGSSAPTLIFSSLGAPSDAVPGALFHLENICLTSASILEDALSPAQVQKNILEHSSDLLHVTCTLS